MLVAEIGLATAAQADPARSFPPPVTRFPSEDVRRGRLEAALALHGIQLPPDPILADPATGAPYRESTVGGHFLLLTDGPAEPEARLYGDVRELAHAAALLPFGYDRSFVAAYDLGQEAGPVRLSIPLEARVVLGPQGEGPRPVYAPRAQLLLR